MGFVGEKTWMNIQKQYEAAERKLNQLRSARREFISEAEQKIQEAADLRYGAEIQVATEEFGAATDAWLTEKESEAIKNAPHPIGTKYLRWEKEQRRWGTPPDKPLKWIATGETARLDVVTRESKFADNLSSYSRPGVGSLILRVNKKNGEPGLKFIENRYFVRSEWRVPTWYPEGEDPNQAEESARKAEEKQKAEEWMNNPTLCPK